MTEFLEVKAESINENTFKLIGSDWMLIAAEKDQKVNAMTASWGGLGVIWEKNVAYVVIRPQRFTKEFVDHADTFSLTFFDEGFKKQLGYMGAVSGRDEDKIAKSGLTVAHSGDTPYFSEAKLVLICRRLFAQGLKPEGFVDQDMIGKFYPDGDFHVLYVAEIEKALVRA